MARLEEVPKVLFFQLGNRGNGCLTSFCRGEKGRNEGVAQEGWALEKVKSVVLN